MVYESTYYGLCSLGDTVTHHGIKGQKWGVRRYQNSDGSFTEAGKKRYYTSDGEFTRRGRSLYKKDTKQLSKLKQYANTNEQAKALKRYDERTAKALKVAGISGTAALAMSTVATPTNIAYALTGAGKKPFKYVSFPSAGGASGYPKSTRSLKIGAIAAATSGANARTNRGFTDRALNEHFRETSARFKKYDALSKLAAKGALGVSLGSLGVAGYNAIQSERTRRRLTTEGHKKAVNAYNAKLNEMRKKYGSLKVTEEPFDKRRKGR